MIKKILIFLTLVFLTPIVINAVEIKTEWQNAWGMTGTERFNGVYKDNDGYFVGYGNYTSGMVNNGGNDAMIIKIQDNGIVFKNESWGGNRNDNFLDMLYFSDKEYIAVGYTDSRGVPGLTIRAQDGLIVKYDKDGNKVWEKTFGGDYTDNFYSIVETSNKGFVIAGSYNSYTSSGLTSNGINDAIIIKYDEEGNIIWQKSWGGMLNDDFYDVITTYDECFVVTGVFKSHDIKGIEHENYNDTNVILIKYDQDGNMLWQKVWGGNSDEKYNEIIQLSNNEIVAVGKTASTNIEGIQNSGGTDGVLVKYDENGNVLWQKSWGGSGDDEFYSIAQTSDGGFIVTGSFNSTNITGLEKKGGKDIVFIRYDKEGNVIWQKNWGGNGNESVSKILLMSDKNFVISGSTMSTNIDGMEYGGGEDAIMVEFFVEYNIENKKTDNGTYTTVQQDDRAIINPTPDKDYKVEKVIVKDNQGNEIETTLQEDGTYSFPLYTDVSVEVIYKEAIENPKTGIIDLMTILFVGIFMSLSGFFIVKKYNERLEF